MDETAIWFESVAALTLHRDHSSEVVSSIAHTGVVEISSLEQTKTVLQITNGELRRRRQP
jgi:hypothetical protein